MKVVFEIDKDGNVLIEGNIKGSSFNAKGTMPLDEDEKSLFSTLRFITKDLSDKCPSDFIYSQSASSK